MAILPNQQISPSVLSADFSRLGEQIDAIIEAEGNVLHLDIMDGHYVPNLTFGPLLVKAIRKLTEMELEAHLMISDPDRYVDDYIKAGADTVLVHPSTCGDVTQTLDHIHQMGAKAGLVINPDEKLDLILPFLDKMDQLLIMSVVPGFGGQLFIPEVLDSLPALMPKLIENNILVEIDGGINTSTIGELGNSGIDRFVAGSAVFNKLDSPKQNYLNLLKLLSKD